MADKTTSELERIYTIPLRDTKDLVRSRRANNAVRDVKRFLTRHMKSDDIWLDNEVNELIWARGKFMIPSRVRVRATRFSDGVVEVTLPEATHAGSVRSELAERREKAAEAPILKGPAAADEDEEDKSKGTSLLDIEGIGPATAEKLVKADFESAEDLAEADPEAVSKKTGYPVEKITPWIDAAKKIAKPKPAKAEKADDEAAEGEAKAEHKHAHKAGEKHEHGEPKGHEGKEGKGAHAPAKSQTDKGAAAEPSDKKA
jgi:large subunit ribosomal protein L31e